jgi:hypothetical protein
MYSSYSFLTLALDRGEWSASRPGCAIPPAKDPWYTLDRRLGGSQLVWTQRLQEKLFVPAGDRTPIVIRKIFQPSKVPTKIYIIYCTHIFFKINMSLIQTTAPPPPRGGGEGRQFWYFCSIVKRQTRHIEGYRHKLHKDNFFSIICFR